MAESHSYWDTRYKECEVLRYVKDGDYKNRDKRNKAMEYIQQEMCMKHLTIEMIKKKIKSIRDTYYLEKNKQKEFNKSGTSPDELYTPRFVWFNEAATFLKYYSGREPSSSLDESHMHSVESSEEMEYGESGEASSNTSISAKCSSEGRTPSFKRKKQKVVPHHISSAIEKLEDLKKIVSEKDEFDYFGMHVTQQLKILSIERALNCQSEFQQILTRERMEYEKEKSLSSRSSHSSLGSAERVFKSPIHGVDIRQNESKNNSLIFVDSPESQKPYMQDSNALDGNSELQNNDILSAAIGELFKTVEF